jgi:hypothetical protein
MRRLALLAVAAVVVLAGCGMLGSDPDPTREQRAVDTLDNATDALAEVETHRSNSEITVTAGNRRVTGETSSVVDFEARRAKTTGTIQGTETASYLVNHTAYVDCRQPWGWGLEEFDSDEDWAAIASPAARQLSMLDSGDLYWNGTETVADTEAILLTGSPTEDAFDQPSVGGSSTLDDVNLDDATVRLWLDAASYRPVESNIQFEISADGESATATVTTEFDSYDEPVTVEVPGEATRDAREGGCPGT